MNPWSRLSQACGDSEESLDPISGFRWHVDAHRAALEPGHGEQAGERDAADTCRLAKILYHSRTASPCPRPPLQGFLYEYFLHKSFEILTRKIEGAASQRESRC